MSIEIPKWPFSWDGERWLGELLVQTENTNSHHYKYWLAHEGLGRLSGKPASPSFVWSWIFHVEPSISAELHPIYPSWDRVHDRILCDTKSSAIFVCQILSRIMDVERSSITFSHISGRILTWILKLTCKITTSVLPSLLNMNVQTTAQGLAAGRFTSVALVKTLLAMIEEASYHKAVLQVNLVLQLHKT